MQACSEHGVQVLVELPLVQRVAEAVARTGRVAKPLQTLRENQPVLAAQLAAQALDNVRFTFVQNNGQCFSAESLALHAGGLQ